MKQIKQYINRLLCKHKNRTIIVLNAFAYWEETALKCRECGKYFKN